MCENVQACYQASELSENSKTHQYTITWLTLIAGHWSHCSLLKEKTTDSQGYAGGAKVKIPLHVQMRRTYSQEWNWPLWLFNFPHDYLTYMTLQLYITLQFYMWVSWTSTLHHIDYNSMAHSSGVAEMTHDMPRHDRASMFMLLLVSMSIYSVAMWSMCS